MNTETMLRREAEEALRRVTEQLGEAMNRIEELEADVFRLNAVVAVYEKIAKTAREPFVLRRKMEERRATKKMD